MKSSETESHGPVGTGSGSRRPAGERRSVFWSWQDLHVRVETMALYSVSQRGGRGSGGCRASGGSEGVGLEVPLERWTRYVGS